MSFTPITLVILWMVGTSAEVGCTDEVVLKKFDVMEAPARRRDGCGLETYCTKWEHSCLKSEQACTLGTTPVCAGSYSSSCHHAETECVEDMVTQCHQWENQCTGEIQTACTSTKEVCNWFLPWPLSEVCGGFNTVCTATELVCVGGFELVCISEELVCPLYGDVCKVEHLTCDLYDEVCLGLTEAVCTDFDKVCVETATACDVVVDVIEAVVHAVENLDTCMDGVFEDGFVKAIYNSDECDETSEPANNVKCYASSYGSSVLDGFTAGCPIPTLSLGVEFGSVHGDKDTAKITFGVGSHDFSVNLFKKQWEKSPIKEFVHFQAETSFEFVGVAELDVHGGNYDLTLPGMKWDFDSTLNLMAEDSEEPCEDDKDDCRLILNKGHTTIFETAFAAGPVPIIITIDAEVYLGAYPKFEGSAFSELKVYFSEAPTLLHAVELPLDSPAAALAEMENMVDGNALWQEIKNNIRVEVSGQMEATASVEFCLGVVFGFHVNGMGLEIDVPLCLTTELEVAANADLSGAELDVDASLKLNALEYPFTINLPDLSSIVETGCGYVQAPLETMSNQISCSPIATCFSNFVDDTCDGVEDALEPLSLDIDLGTLHLTNEKELWSDSFKLKTGGDENDRDDSPVKNVSGNEELVPSNVCTRYEGLNMVSGKAGGAAPWPTTESVEGCEDLCMADDSCDMFTWHTETASTSWKKKCVMWTITTARAEGRETTTSWPSGSNHITGVCNHWQQMDYGDRKTCSTDEVLRTSTATTLESCQTTCMNEEFCTHVYFKGTGDQCTMYSSCAKMTTAGTDGELWTISDASFDIKAKLTFVKTGCPNTQASTTWWQMVSVQPARGESRVFQDMYDYCMLVKNGFASTAQKEMCCGADNMSCRPSSCTLQEHFAGDGAWRLVFRQTLPFLYKKGELNMYEDDSTADNFAILDKLDANTYNGRYYFKLVWPEDKTTFYTWSQTSNPVKHEVSGYEGIHVPYTGRHWGGLEPSGNAAIMDGSVGHSNWFYAVGATAIWNNGIPSYAKSDSDNLYPQQQTELYAYRGYIRYGNPGQGYECLSSRVKTLATDTVDVNECAELAINDADCKGTKFQVNNAEFTCQCLKKSVGNCNPSMVEGTVLYQWL